MRRALFGVLSFMIGMTSIVAYGVEGPDSINESVVINVFPAYAPKGPDSPHWGSYVNTAIAAIEAEASSSGSRATDPGAYEVVSGPIAAEDMMYTNYNSWLGMADPSPAFGSLLPQFQGEFGNRIHFGLHIVSDGTVAFSLEDLDWKLDSDDDTNYFDQQGDFVGASYSPTRVGIDFGLNGVKGGGDDIIYDNGEAGTTPIHELVYVGVGDGFFSEEPAPLNNQDDIDTTLRALLGGCPSGCTYDLQGIYTLQNPLGGDPLVGAGAVSIQVTPGFAGDFDHSRDYSSYDKDLLTTAIVAGTNDIFFDIDADGLVNFTDLEIMVHDLVNTYFGDANCDGEFDSEDLIEVFIAGKYETGDPAVWSEGDWTADGVFTSSDLVTAFIDGGYNLGPRPAVAVVPEPASAALALIGMVLLAVRRR